MAHFTGNKHVKRILWEALTDNHIGELRIILNGKGFSYYFGEDFSADYMETRIMDKIALKTLRITPKDDISEKDQDYDWYMHEKKHIPFETKKEKWTCLVIWDDNVAVFDLDNLKCEIYTGGKEFEKYDQMFHEIWEK